MATLRDLPALRINSPDIALARSRGATAGLQQNQLQEQNRLRELFARVPPTSPANQAQLQRESAGISPDAFTRVSEIIGKQTEAERAAGLRKTLATAKTAAGILSAPPEQQVSLFEAARAQNPTAFGAPVTDQASAQAAAIALIREAQTIDQITKNIPALQGPQKGVSLSQGQQLVDPITGQPRGPGVPPKSDVLSREAFEQRKALREAGKASTTINVGTEAQNKAATFASRMLAANESITKLEGVGSATLSAGAKLLPNFLTPSDLQVLDTTSRDFAGAILRKESGAAITADEVKETKKIYIPSPGDGQANLLIKRANRLRAIENMQREGGPAAKSVSDVPGVVDPNGGLPDDLTTLSATELLERIEGASEEDEKAIEAELKRRGAL